MHHVVDAAFPDMTRWSAVGKLSLRQWAAKTHNDTCDPREHLIDASSRLQQDRARRGAAFQRCMRLGRIGKRVGLPDRGFDDASGNRSKHILRPPPILCDIGAVRASLFAGGG
jgi:hypothetical protein